MILAILSACILVAITVAIHATGLAMQIRSLIKLQANPPTRPWPITRILIHTTLWLILIHVLEISVWGLFYLWQGCLPDAEAALYFSGTTYTTIGYGDLVLARPWRLLGPVQGLTGILMCGWSTGYFIIVVSRLGQPLLAKGSGGAGVAGIQP